jgi:hypothetical protein
MTEIERPMTIDEIVKEFDEFMVTRVGDTPAKRVLMRAAATLGGKFTLPELVEAVLGREMTTEESYRLLLLTEDAEGSA